VQVGNPFLEKLLMEACLELARLDAVVAMQDLGAAGLTCALAELTARGGVGAEVDLAAVPTREDGMSAYEILLSESQERMLIVVRPDRVADVRAVFDRYELTAAEIGTIIDEPVVRARLGAELACRVPGRALADDAPRYVIGGRPLAPPEADLATLAAEPPTAATLLELLRAPNVRDRKPIWRQYDHMNGTNTLVGPGAGDAAVLRVKGTRRALAVAIDGPAPARLGALDPYLAGVSAVLDGAMNVATMGARPIGITDCLNFGSPETDRGAWQLERAIDGIAAACRALAVPVVSGNVSLYNETPSGPILPTPVVGTVGLLDDREVRLRLGWADGDVLLLLGEAGDDPASLAGSELAWRQGRRGGAPTLDVAAVARLVDLVPRLAGRNLISGAHDASVGGLGVALARMAIAGGVGAEVDLGATHPTALLFGERVGRLVVAVTGSDVASVERAASAAGVACRRIGTAGGSHLSVDVGAASVRVTLDELAMAWRAA
jgi:phosphoribosylformylglycinamidine synthase